MTDINSITWEPTKEIKADLIIMGNVVFSCSVCGTYEDESDSFYELENGAYVCSKGCFIEYVLDYFDITVVKGEKFSLYPAPC